MLNFEKKAKTEGFNVIIGVDEAGRGPLAGPVVAAAVFLRTQKFSSPINDSKKISPLLREQAFHEIQKKAVIGVGIISETVIDRCNILMATFIAIERAVQELMSRIPECQNAQDVCLLIDGNQFKSSLPYAYQTIVKGDEKVLSIMCASIVAKVTRDRILNIYDHIFPHYGFKQHKGYATEAHREVLQELGPCEIHRRSFTWGNVTSAERESN